MPVRIGTTRHVAYQQREIRARHGGHRQRGWNNGYAQTLSWTGAAELRSDTLNGRHPAGWVWRRLFFAPYESHHDAKSRRQARDGPTQQNLHSAIRKTLDKQDRLQTSR